METKLTAQLNIISKVITFLTIFLVPLTWLPFTSEVYELPKYTVLYAGVLIALFVYLVRAIALKTITFRRTPLDGPLLFMGFILAIISFGSTDRFLSFFGEYSFLDWSFFSWLAFILLYFLLTQHVQSRREVYQVLGLVLASTVLCAVPALLSPWKHFTWPIVGEIPTTLPHSSLILTGVFFVASALLALGILADKQLERRLVILASVALGVSLVFLFLFANQWLWIAFSLAGGLLLIIFLTHSANLRSWWSPLAFTILVSALIFIFLGTPQLVIKSRSNEFFLDSKISFNIARQSAGAGIKEFLLGTGPGTFFYAFSQYRPVELNVSPVWSLRFYQSASGLLGLFVSGGILACLGFFILLLVVLGTVVTPVLRRVNQVRHKKLMRNVVNEYGAGPRSPLLLGSLFIVWLLLTITFGLLNFSATQWLIWWTIMALLMIEATDTTERSVWSLVTMPQYALVVSFSFIILFAGLIVWGVYIGRFYAAEALSLKSLQRPSTERIALIQSAINLNPYRSGLQLALADAFLLRASEIGNNGGDPAQVYQTVALAIEATEQARRISPHNVTVWEYTALLYANLRALIPEANSFVKNTLRQAVVLEPTNPRFYLLLSQTEEFNGSFEAAQEAVTKAIKLKPNLLEAYVRSADLSLQGKNAQAAIATLEQGLPYGGSNNPDYLVQLALLYFNENKVEYTKLAEQYFRQALFWNTNHSNALYGLGTLLERTGQRTEALPLFKRVLELNPDNEQIKNKLKSLNSSASDDATL